ncbi:CDP-glycerol glycerophosphotransferase family protein [Neptunomonas qingdaonensis]|uniref:CDP-glycerol glycerophosphotransferase, TagB/SpsB family n=1 Tax=Neptunomonas qingdaonensis TaxID=1045558 RepID=A0A1I2UMW6_9GAMM|nr:CDP-glycerol glycerophosphotransferase family protein [Neptunomonas qingdaonensis]SFG78514.1 CDP-glycerol glycerophosphotransferase, TagB/SpsB family [Neptunomonas qingdaonensis]
MEKIAFTLLLLSYQPSAFAYLDPGSGSILLSALVGVVATVLFSMKGFYYKIKSFVVSLFGVNIEKNKHKLVFYSEGKYYWHTFKPILEALNKKGVEAVYLTSSEEDEGLSFRTDYISTRYIGKGNKAYTYLNMLEAKVCVMTTPGIGVLQIRRSKGVGHYAHIVHAPTDMGTYKLYSFEYYDSIFCSGAHQEKTIRVLEDLRNFHKKTLVKAGCPYMDVLGLRLEKENAKPSIPKNKKTVLVAPTWGEHNLLKIFGAKPIKALLNQGYEVIIRPHPQSYMAEPEIIVAVKDELSSFENIKWDNSPDNFESLRDSDILISALSGIVFDYAFVFEKPVITVELDYSFIGQEANDLPYKVWELDVLNKIGECISSDDLNNISGVVERLLTDPKKKVELRAFRDDSLYNYKHSGSVIADNLVKIMEDL